MYPATLYESLGASQSREKKRDWLSCELSVRQVGTSNFEAKEEVCSIAVQLQTGSSGR